MTTKIPVTLLDTTDPYPAGDGSALTHLLPLLHVRDEQASGATPGAATAATWNVRTLQTVKTNEVTGASLASNQITLPAGTYYVEAIADAGECDHHKARLRNVTDTATAVVGMSAWSYSGANTAHTNSLVCGRFTLAAQKVLQLEHYQQTGGLNNLGSPTTSGEVEVYAEVKIWKIA